MTATLDRPADVEPIGSTTPRLFTPPVVTGKPGPCGCGCALSPRTSLGFEAIAFAEDVLLVELLPWQRWWLIHALELNPDGSFRFSTILTLIARQNGKTTLLKIVALWFLYLGHGKLVLGVAQALNIARESWDGAVQLAEGNPDLRREVENVRRANGEQCLTIHGNRRYMISAATRSAGRGLSVDLLIMDELREQRGTEAWAALSNTTMARPNALIVGISNQGDDESVVLNGLRDAALAGTDPALFLAEWSAADDAPIDSVEAMAAANPGLGRTITLAKLRTMFATTAPTDWRTENLCQRVANLDAILDPTAWQACRDLTTDAQMAALLDRHAYVVDVAPDGHTVFAAAARTDEDVIPGQVVREWPTLIEARDGLRDLCTRLRPRVLGWFPGGPGEQIRAELEALAADELVGTRAFTRRADGHVVRELTEAGPGLIGLVGQDYPGLCEGFVTLVQGGRFRHGDEPVLNAQVGGAVWKDQGDGRRFARKGVGRVSALYAVAGAVELARRLPVPTKAPKGRIF